MTLNFNVTGEERKALVRAISEITGVKSRYLGAPGFAFQVGAYTIDRYGAVTGAEVSDALLAQLEEREFHCGTVSVAESVWNLPGKSVIEVPLMGFSQTALDNLERLVAGKAPLIRKALGADSLQIEQTEDALRFPWFSWDMDAENAKACETLIAKLCELAKTQKRVTVRELAMTEGDSEKFALRCFLLRLGFIGREYAADRKVLLSKLSGSSAFKHGGNQNYNGGSTRNE
jgi:hypothetical protein